jgi:hypothetical protein
LLFQWKNLIFDDFFSYSWHKNCLCHGIKYPIFPPSKMPINYSYARNIKEFLLFMPGIFTKDLRYMIFHNEWKFHNLGYLGNKSGVNFMATAIFPLIFIYTIRNLVYTNHENTFPKKIFKLNWPYLPELSNEKSKATPTP